MILTILILLGIGLAVYTCILHSIGPILGILLAVGYTLGCIIVFLLLVALFPGIAYWVSGLLGFVSPINCVYLIVIFLLLARQFMLSIRVSQLDSRLRVLTERVALNQQRQEQTEQKAPDDKMDL